MANRFRTVDTRRLLICFRRQFGAGMAARDTSGSLRGGGCEQAGAEEAGGSIPTRKRGSEGYQLRRWGAMLALLFYGYATGEGQDEACFRAGSWRWSKAQRQPRSGRRPVLARLPSPSGPQFGGLPIRRFGDAFICAIKKTSGLTATRIRITTPGLSPPQASLVYGESI